MKNKLFFCILFLLPLALMSQKKWASLFDGQSISGWHNYNKTTMDGWVIEDGALTTDGKQGDLISDKEYGDFILEFDFKVSPKGNSGLIYKIIEKTDPGYGASYMSGPEYQIIDDLNYPAQIKDEQKTGANYDIYKPLKLTLVKPAGEWNHGVLKIKNNKVSHFLNGKKVNSYTYGDAKWIADVAKSKFAKWPYANAHAKGKIGLQGHNDRVYFKNIRIAEL